ncbi:MAG: putative metabolite transport protein CsbC [Planctomycetota bacterium]
MTPPAADAPRSVQNYLDETPRWADATPVASAPLTRMQMRLWWLAAAGKFFEGLVIFLTGVAVPIIAADFTLSGIELGVLTSSPLAGILLGATLLGGLADTFGRRTIFIVEMAIFTTFLLLISVAPNFPLLVLCLFGLGLSLGGDYPTAHLVISESIPSRSRGRLVLGAFGFQSIGALAGTAVGFGVLSATPTLDAWRWMYAMAIPPALFVLVGRFFITESPAWLHDRGRTTAAREQLARLLARTPPYPRQIALADTTEPAIASERSGGYRSLFSPRCRRATILASVPWFLQDLGTYGIGLFTPTILAAAYGHHRSDDHHTADLFKEAIVGAEGAALVDGLLVLGIAAAVLLADRISRITLQSWGFLGCAAGLAIAGASTFVGESSQLAFIVVGFMVFNFANNLGPNAQTYLIAGEVFPLASRGRGAGFAASVGKLGAVLTAFLFPVLLADLGVSVVLGILVATSILGAIVTRLFRIETAGVDLETLHGER